ncbi:hypothetical protein D9619_011024 [Psilocybe cf. subviscida]|uniref:Nephrocystin 3-like N-terminal domain-containing protein n=1 Tax=Psilocybe cf. subviscida TaxID=2480587 RepID=A0A8H5B8Q9_9AGAR|nr:hypothetical protein D9619_011024 [Psilocybe cf. subviscida]
MSNQMFTAASNVTISGGYFVNQINSQISALDKLSAAAAHSALHDAPARTDESRCYQNTRVNVLENLEHWARSICVEDKDRGQDQDMYMDEDENRGKDNHIDAPIFWLHGGAGAGKSAIMQTLAERCVAQGLMLGAFFFSRSDPTRNTAEVLIPTLAYQLAQFFPSALQVLDPTIDRDPLISKKSLPVQLLSLLVRPLQYLVQLGSITDAPHSPRVFLIDGLDECSDPVQQQAIIRAVAAVCYEHRIPVKFLIASRPEQAISTSFAWYQEANRVLGAIPLSEDPDAKDDIHRFVENKFLDICLWHPFKHMIPSEWPSLYDIKKLVRKSSSQFIYASTAMEYIRSAKESPVRSLQVVLGLEVSRTTSPFAGIDSLYRHIIGSAAHRDKVLPIIAYCVFTKLPSSVDVVSVMLNYSRDDLSIFMADMNPLVTSYRPPRGWRVMRSEASSGALHVNKDVYLASILGRCFQLMDLHIQEQGTSLRLLPHSRLSEHIITTIKTSGHHIATQEVLRQYGLRKFHEFQRRVEKAYGIVATSVGRHIHHLPEFLMAVYLIKPFDGAQLFRDCLEDFLDILESYIIGDGTPLAPAILPLICLGYPAKAIQEIHAYYSRGTTSYHILEYSRESVTVLDLITAEDLASIRHSINTSPECLAVAAEAILGFLIDDVKLGRSSTYSAHRSWLQRIKPGKHVATGTPRIASVFHAKYTSFSALQRNIIYKHRWNTRDRFLGTALHSRLDSLSILLRTVNHLLGALLWVLPKAGFSEGLVRYSKRMFPWIMYQRDTVLVRRVRNCLDSSMLVPTSAVPDSAASTAALPAPPVVLACISSVFAADKSVPLDEPPHRPTQIPRPTNLPLQLPRAGLNAWRAHAGTSMVFKGLEEDREESVVYMARILGGGCIANLGLGYWGIIRRGTPWSVAAARRRCARHAGGRVIMAALAFLSDPDANVDDEGILVLHTLPLPFITTTSLSSATLSSSAPTPVPDPSPAFSSFASATSSIPCLSSVVKIIKHEFVNNLAEQKSTRKMGLF